MKTPLSNITLSTKYGPHLPTADTGPIKYLKATHFDEDNQLNAFTASYVSTEGKEDKFLLQESDIILAAKGFRHFAWTYDSSYGPCIASSLFYIMRIDTQKVLSKYLTLCINAPKFQHKLKMIGLGASVPVIPKKELLRLKVEIPPLEQQQKIIRITNLIDQQIELEKQILEKRKILKTGLIDFLTSKQL